MFEHNIFASDWERFVQVVGFEPTFSASQMRRHAYLPTPNYARRRCVFVLSGEHEPLCVQGGI